MATPLDIVAYLKRQAERFTAGMQRVSQRRQAWAAFETRAATRFNSLCAEAKAQRLFEYLYVDSSTRNRHSKGTPNFVTLFWGQHPTGLCDFRAPVGTTSLDVEGGCALHFSQGPSGEVACILYPFASHLRMPPDRYYVYRVFSSPDKIEDKNIDDAVRTLFALAHYSSFAGHPALTDWYAYTKLRVFSLVRRSWHGDWLKMTYAVLKKYIEEKVNDLASGETPSNPTAETDAQKAAHGSP